MNDKKSIKKHKNKKFKNVYDKKKCEQDIFTAKQVFQKEINS